MHGAGAALRNAAAVFRAGEADLLPDRPQQRRGRIDVNVVGLAIDGQLHCGNLPWELLGLVFVVVLLTARQLH